MFVRLGGRHLKSTAQWLLFAVGIGALQALAVRVAARTAADLWCLLTVPLLLSAVIAAGMADRYLFGTLAMRAVVADLRLTRLALFPLRLRVFLIAAHRTFLPLCGYHLAVITLTIALRKDWTRLAQYAIAPSVLALAVSASALAAGAGSTALGSERPSRIPFGTFWACVFSCMFLLGSLIDRYRSEIAAAADAHNSSPPYWPEVLTSTLIVLLVGFMTLLLPERDGPGAPIRWK